MNLTDVFKAHGLRVDYAPPAPQPEGWDLPARLTATEEALGLPPMEPEAPVKVSISGTLYDENVIVTGEPEGGSHG